jgi:anti-anti-sigma regulatory factor
MLRISVLDGSHTTRLKVEGKLAHEWVAEMEKAWSALAGATRKKKVIVDLADISFVDDPGKDLLSRIRQSGGELVGSGPMVAALIEEIQSKAAATRSSLKKEAASLLLILAFLAFSALQSAA